MAKPTPDNLFSALVHPPLPPHFSFLWEISVWIQEVNEEFVFSLLSPNESPKCLTRAGVTWLLLAKGREKTDGSSLRLSPCISTPVCPCFSWISSRLRFYGLVCETSY